MALDPLAQALSLSWAAALGALLGLCYDLLRPPRRGGGAVWASLLDILFGLLAAGAAFVYAMSAGEGRLGLWALTASLGGFLLYERLLSPCLLPVFSSVYTAISGMIASTKKFLEKLQFFQKKTSKM